MLVLVTAASAEAAPLSAEELRGKQIYATGTSPSGETITAYVGADSIPLPASSAPCASCHGANGRGRPEGGVIPSDITWGNLSKSYGHQHSYGREHQAFTAASAAVAISEGLDPAGNRLDPSMPVYGMAADDLAALIVYLKRIETDFDPGLSEHTIRLATLLPLSGRMASLGNAMAALMQAFVAELNASGGIHGRSIELDIIPFGDSPTIALGNLRQALTEQRIFALLGAYSVGIEAELAQLMEREQVPLIGPFTLQPPPVAALDRYTFYLFSGERQQVRALVDEAAEQIGDDSPVVAVAGADNDTARELSAAVTAQVSAHDWQAPRQYYYPTGGLDATALAGQVVTSDSKALFFFGSSGELGEVLSQLASTNEPPLVFLPASLATPALFDAPAALDGKVFIAYPRLPSDVTASGRDAYAVLRDKYQLSAEHASAQLATLAAAVTLIEVLKTTGKDLSRKDLIDTLESLQNFDSGLAPPISYSLNRRIGALGAHVVRLDLGARTFVPVGDWRSLR